MKPVFRVALVFLLTCVLALPVLPNAAAQATADFTWEIPYPHWISSPGGPDYLPQYLGISYDDLTAGTTLTVNLKVGSDGAAEMDAILTLDDKGEIHLSGRGIYERLEQTPLYQGKFDVETAAGVVGGLSLAVYPAGNEQRATLSFGSGSNEPASISFGSLEGNISAIISQWNDYQRSRVKVPSSYVVNGQRLTLQPAPYLADGEVLVPLRPLLQALGAQVSWDGVMQTILVRKDGTSLRLSPANQTLQVNNAQPQPLTITQPQAGTTFCPLEPLVQALGIPLNVRGDGSAYLTAYEAIPGRFQMILVDDKSVILQNDTNRPYNLSDWQLTVYLPFDENGPLHEFRFPANFVLQPGQQVQVLADPPQEPDGKHVLAWEHDTTRGPGNVQIMLRIAQSGNEYISVGSRLADFYVGNWRLVSANGRPAFNLPNLWVPRGMSIGIYGVPGEPSSPYDLRWPNLPAVEEAYAEQQIREAEQKEESRKRTEQQYLPVAERLGLDAAEYLIYSTAGTFEEFNTGAMEPFSGNAAASRSLMYADWELTRRLLQTGDTMPAYLINRNGQEAYIALIKQDGSYIAFHLELIVDDGYYTWHYQQVLPE